VIRSHRKRALRSLHASVERVRPNLQASFDHLDDEALFEHLARSR